MVKKFYMFPFNQDMMILYQNHRVLRTIYFRSLYFQITPKNSIPIRFRKSYFGHLLFKLTPLNRIVKLDISNNNILLVYVNNGKQVQFDFDNKFRPIRVFTGKFNSLTLIENKYLGLPLLTEYTLTEFNSKYPLIKRALMIRWSIIKKTKSHHKLHGDFTHFNVLSDDSGQLSEIDGKCIVNSDIFDHYYFYSYLRQCLSKCITLSKNDFTTITTILDRLILDVFQIESLGFLLNLLSKVVIEDAKGLANPKASLDTFKELLVSKRKSI